MWAATHNSERRHAARDRHRHEARAPPKRALRARGTAVGGREGWGQRASRRGAPKRRAGGVVGGDAHIRPSSSCQGSSQTRGSCTQETRPASTRHGGRRSRGVGSARQEEARPSVGRVGLWAATHISERRHAARDRHRHEARAPTKRRLRARGTAVAAVERGGVSASRRGAPKRRRVGLWAATHISDRRHAARDRHRHEARAPPKRALRARGTAVGGREGWGQRVKKRRAQASGG